MLSTFTNPNYEGLGLDRQQWESYLGLLRGDDNAAMFSEFDADPQLNGAAGTTTTVLSSDDIANANRDGQNATYYMDLDPYAVSGSFDVDLSVTDGMGNVKTVTITIAPVFYPGGGPVDPDKTIAAIKNALASASNVGINWPAAIGLGPVDVQLVCNPLNPGDLKLTGNFAEELGSAWDPTAHGINGTFYVYQITFQGEVHNTTIGLKMSADGHDDLARKAGSSATQQVITFSSFSGMGWMSLSIGTIGPSADFSVSSTESPLQIAAVLQTYLDSLVPGTTVTWLAGTQTPTNATFPYNFLVTFPSVEPQLTVNGPTDTTKIALAPTPAVTMLGQTSPVPDIVEEVYGSEGTTQHGASIAMTSSGSFVEVWNEYSLDQRWQL